VFRPTERRGHAVDLAREAALEGFATVAAAGGDGTAHELAIDILPRRLRVKICDPE
jgi:diacylglycerol kinase (ATP)